MSFQQGLSGLNAASKDLDVIGNNVANSGTYGFKESTAVFADAYAASLSGGGVNNVGIGVKTVAVAQQFTQGNITTSNNPLDMAINGDGFYRLSTNGLVSYSRNGQFQLDKSGYIVNATGDRLTGYAADANGTIAGGTPVDIRLDMSDIAPRSTTSVETGVKLDSRRPIPTTAFTPTDSNSFNYTTSLTAYDSLGNARTFSTYYVKTAENTYDVHGVMDGVAVGAGPLGTLSFNTDGTLNETASTDPITVTAPALGGAAPLSFTVDYSGSTQRGSLPAVDRLVQDGFAAGRLDGFTIGNDGTILGRYTNGESKNLAAVALANFVAPNGLQPLGDNKWAESSASGQPLVGTPGSGTLGVLQSSALENSNVDLTKELVDLIMAQRVYQANAQTIKTQDQVLQTLVTLR